jgi:hypothetical protein
MATYKVDVKMKFGKYSAHVWKATERPGDAVAGDLDSSKAAVTSVIDGVKAAGFSEGDEIIFRDNAYASLAELKHVMNRAPY